MNLKPNLKSPTTFYLIRHAETLGNVEEKLIGQSESPITDNGIIQAEDLAEKLKDVRFVAAYSSDLSRSIRTAQIIAKPHKIEVNTSALVRELSFGKYEGWKSEDFMKIFGEIVKQREKMTNEERLAHMVDSEIETDLSAAKRMARFLDETAQTHPGETVSVVSHGAIMRSFLIYSKQFTYQNLPHGTIKNCSYVVLKKQNDKYKLEKLDRIDLIKETR